MLEQRCGKSVGLFAVTLVQPRLLHCTVCHLALLLLLPTAWRVVPLLLLQPLLFGRHWIPLWRRYATVGNVLSDPVLAIAIKIMQ